MYVTINKFSLVDYVDTLYIKPPFLIGFKRIEIS